MCPIFLRHSVETKSHMRTPVFLDLSAEDFLKGVYYVFGLCLCYRVNI